MKHLKKRGFQLASRCLMCGKAEENLNHLLIHFAPRFGVFGRGSSMSRACFGSAFAVKDLLLEWPSFPMRKKISKKL